MKPWGTIYIHCYASTVQGEASQHINLAISYVRNRTIISTPRHAVANTDVKVIGGVSIRPYRPTCDYCIDLCVLYEIDVKLGSCYLLRFVNSILFEEKKDDPF